MGNGPVIRAITQSPSKCQGRKEGREEGRKDAREGRIDGCQGRKEV
jgi:hypothetical protein